jgi:hypothetical protein
MAPWRILGASLAAGAALPEMVKQINLFAYRQKKSGPSADIFMGQMCYGDFSYARNMSTFFQIFLHGPEEVKLNPHICWRGRHHMYVCVKVLA